MPGVRPVVGEIAANSIAAEAQIAPGTELKAVDGIETPDWDAVRLQLVDKIGDESTTITVAPFGSDQRRDVKLDLRHWAFEPDKEDPVSSLGIRPRGPQIEPVLENVQPNSAASKAGLGLTANSAGYVQTKNRTAPEWSSTVQEPVAG